jgi:hypothetical protein
MENKMELRFIVVDRGAATELVAQRAMQSVEFNDGKSLALLLQGLNPTLSPSKKFSKIKTKDGLFFLAHGDDKSDVLVIDLVEAPVFSKRSDSETLFLFQKILRFSIKRWERMAFNFTEKLLANSTKGLLFPFSHSAQVPFRLTFELAPDKRRREKRAKGEELLLYKCGTDEGKGAAEEASTTIFRKAIDAIPEAHQLAKNSATQVAELNSCSAALAVTRLAQSGKNMSVGEATYDEWEPLLTTAQKDFISAAIVAPHRIEGPAGTGKTLSLVLKCIFALREAHQREIAHSALFIAHSEATRRNIERLFAPELDLGVISIDGAMSLQTLKVTTLNTYCAEVLNTEISETEFLDRDAFESKQTQLLYTLEALQEALSNELPTHKEFMSKGFIDYLNSEDHWVIAEMLQHEISVKIKGRAEEDESKYYKLPRLRYGLPVENEGDRVFAFLAFRNYRRRLENSGQFDTDDIVLSALGQLNTPIWRRRRAREGFDSIFIDETHLFNLNELSVFHRITRSDHLFPIIYSADVSQSLGDRGWDDETFDEAMGGSDQAGNSQPTVFKSIFRCSPEIVDLAFSVTSSGATLFTNFHDPVAAANSTFTYEEERKCALPIYRFSPTDELMYKKAFSRADDLASELGCSKAEIAIVAFGDYVFSELERFARELNKPLEVIKQRGDYEIVKRAKNSGRFILSAPDYIGGLEFSAVVLVGVDKDRVPPRPSDIVSDSLNFLSYASHQRLYVAITRARFRVEILGLATRGASALLNSAIANKLIDCSPEN